MQKATIVTTRWSLWTSGVSRVSQVRFSALGFLFCCLWLCGGLLFAASPTQAAVKAGDILVVDQNAGTRCTQFNFPCGALFVVNSKTGQRTILSDFGNPAQGSLGTGGLASVAVGRAGQIFVTSITYGPTFDGGSLFRVNPRTGQRTVLSDFSQGDMRGFFYYGLAVDAKGQVIANLQRSDWPDTLVRVHPKTDERALITDLTNPAQGTIESDSFMTDLALERSGKILISTVLGGDYSSVAIFRVQPKTGKRQLLSDFTNAEQGVLAGFFFGVGLAVETSGQILVNAAGTTAEVILRIDPTTGQRTVLSNLYDAAQGPLGQSPAGLAVESSGTIVVGVYKNPVTTDTYSLFRVKPKTGRRVVLSDSDNPAQGPPFAAITHIAVVPKDSDEGDESESEAEGQD